MTLLLQIAPCKVACCSPQLVDNYQLNIKGEINRSVELFERVMVRITDELEESTGKRKVKLTLV